MRILSLTIVTSLLAACSTLGSDPAALLRQAEQATGAAAVKTLSFSGRGSGSVFGQAFQPGNPWPGLNYSTLSRQVDYERAAMREDFGRSRSEPTGGGATPLMGQGEARVTSFVAGDLAWNLAGTNTVAAPVARDARVHELWTTPHGAIKAAQRFGARSAGSDAAGNPRLAFDVPGRLSATLTVDGKGLPLRIDSRMPHPVLGDTAMSAEFSDWKDAGGGVMFPMRIRQNQGGWQVLDLAVQQVQVNPAVDIAVPEAVRNFSERVVAEKLADGLWHLGGGTHNSVAIEMSNHVVLVEAPLYDGRTQAVLAEVAKLAPGKPVRTVINSHHHFDHAGGLRAAAAAGATLVVSEGAKPYFEKVFANPNSLSPDALQRANRAPSFMPTAGGRLALTDGPRRIEVYEMQGSIHAQGFLMVYLPAERVLIQADAYTPAVPGSPPPPVANANHLNLIENIERLQLKVDRIAPLHGRVVPLAELYAMVGRKP